MLRVPMIGREAARPYNFNHSFADFFRPPDPLPRGEGFL
jgi:hypothetical protein